MLNITSKQLEITQPIRERVESRIAKLERYNIPLINPHVIITEEKPQFKVEATINIPNGDLFAQAKHEDLYAAINDMGQKLDKQLNRFAHKDESKRTDKTSKVDFETDLEEAV